MGKKAATGLVLLAASCWGSSGVFIRFLGGYGLDSLQISVFRCVSTAVLFWAYCLFRHRAALRVPLKDLALLAFTGLVCVFLFTVCYARTAALTSLSVTAILVCISPVFVLLLSAPLLAERLTPRKLLVMAAVLLGSSLASGLVGNLGAINGAGLLYGLAASITYALYTITGSILGRRHTTPVVMAWVFLFAAVAACLAANLGGIAAVVRASPAALGWGLGAGLVNCAIPFTVYTLALRHLEAGRAAIFATAEPVVASLLGAVLFREALTAVNLVGIAIVVAGLAAMNLQPKKGPEP